MNPTEKKKPTSLVWMASLAILSVSVFACYGLQTVPALATTYSRLVTFLTWFVPVGLVLAPLVGIARSRPSRLLTWSIFAASPAVVLASILISTHWPSDSFPSLSTYLNIGSVVLTILFLSLVLHHRSSGINGAGLIDATVIAVAAFLVSWTFVIAPNLHSDLTLPTKMVYMALGVMDVVMVWLCLQMAFDGGMRSLTYRIMTLSFIGAASTDSLLLAASFTEIFTNTQLTMCVAVRNIFFVMTMTAPLHPSMRLFTQAAPLRQSDNGGHLRLGFVTLASLITPGLLVIEYFKQTHIDLLVIGIGSAVMFLLVVARMESMIRKQAQTNAALDDSLQKLKTADVQLRHAQKLKAVGKLAAGVAHEINTPIQFITDNLRFIESSYDSMNSMCMAYRRFMPRELEQAEEEISRAGDLEMLHEEMPSAFQDTMSGISRVAKIVSAMKSFGDVDNSEMQTVDINEAVNNIVVVTQSEVDPVANVVVELGDLPGVTCYPGDLNQVLLNLVLNATHAVRDVEQSLGRRGTITIRTFLEDNGIGVSVEDNGVGIPEEIRDRIFEPFFTTKEVGEGTGQGLTLVWNLVVDRHHGSVQVNSEINQGTSVTFHLPLLELAHS